MCKLIGNRQYLNKRNTKIWLKPRWNPKKTIYKKDKDYLLMKETISKNSNIPKSKI